VSFKTLLASIAADYENSTPTSRQVFERASKVLPGGVSGNLRYFAPYPLYMRGGSGAQTIDVDGKAYIDCFLCNGPLLLGHKNPDVVEAIAKAADYGPLLLNPDILAQCAEELCDLIPCAERVRFLNSGTEALTSAVRYARGYTGRTKILKFFGHYHGQDDQFLIGASPRREPFSKGIAPSAYADTLTIPINDTNALFQTIAENKGAIATAVLDPAMHAGGLWGVDKSFLETLRQVTYDEGIVLILDEVITGFRLAPGGAQEVYGITPDLATFAKALGAGERLAAVAGKAEIMQVVDPVAGDPNRRVFQSGTGNDSTAGILAATAAMQAYRRLGRDGEYTRLSRVAEKLASGLIGVFAEFDLPLRVNQRASMLQLFLTDQDPEFSTFYDLDQTLIDAFYLAMMVEGVVLSLPTSNHIYLSFEHGDTEVAAILDAARTVLRRYPFLQAFKDNGD
jgi:glutamate-1-semialdehyde 2,1-aminomutase